MCEREREREEKMVIMKEAHRKNKENKQERECVEKMPLREMKIKG